MTTGPFEGRSNAAGGFASRVLIKPTSPASAGVLFELVGEDEPGEGSGSWADVTRPRRRSAVEWLGEPACSYVLPLMLDGIETRRGHNTPVEAQIRTVRSWKHKTKKTGQPPVLRLAGPLHFPATMRWVLDDIAWGAKQRDNQGRRIQQMVTLTLKEYVEPTVVRSPAKKHRDHKGGGKK